jgi:hypothetical protein
VSIERLEGTSRLGRSVPAESRPAESRFNVVYDRSDEHRRQKSTVDHEPGVPYGCRDLSL